VAVTVSAARRPNPREQAVDVAIAMGLTALSVLAIAGGAEDAGGRDPISITLLLLESLPLVFRRWWPLPILAITAGATLLHVLLAPSNGVNEGLGSLVALYTVAELYDRRTSAGIAIVMGIGFASIYVVAGSLPGSLNAMVGTLVVVALAWAFGDWSRTRRLYADAMEERTRLLEMEREVLAARAVREERERIARELHDVVTHHVSVMAIQSGAALSALDRRPDQARTALEAIGRTAREALLEMRRMVGVLGPSGAGPDPAADSGRMPVPGLERLGELVEDVRAAGLPVELSIAGDRRALDAGVELSAYRIVQEALTNVLKHARGARARVELRFDPDALTIAVTDEGGMGERDLGGGGGRGLIGLRERVALFGGEFEAGPTATGFRVAARLPVEPAASRAHVAASSA
jgi:signal transduction histidine kinase